MKEASPDRHLGLRLDAAWLQATLKFFPQAKMRFKTRVEPWEAKYQIDVAAHLERHGKIQALVFLQLGGNPHVALGRSQRAALRVHLAQQTGEGRVPAAL